MRLWVGSGFGGWFGLLRCDFWLLGLVLVCCGWFGLVCCWVVDTSVLLASLVRVWLVGFDACGCVWLEVVCCSGVLGGFWLGISWVRDWCSIVCCCDCG